MAPEVCKGAWNKLLSAAVLCCRVHEAEAAVRGSMDEECDNICRLTCFVVSRVLTDWQAALLYTRTYPYAAHVMVRPPSWKIHRPHLPARCSEGACRGYSSASCHACSLLALLCS